MISLFIFMVSVTSDLVTRSWSIIFARSYNLIRPFSANQWPREKKRENKVFVLFVWGFFELQDGEATENWNKAQKMNWIDCCSCLSKKSHCLMKRDSRPSSWKKKTNNMTLTMLEEACICQDAKKDVKFVERTLQLGFSVTRIQLKKVPVKVLMRMLACSSQCIKEDTPPPILFGLLRVSTTIGQTFLVFLQK